MNLGKLCIDINKMFIIHHIFIITNITEIIVVIEVVTVGDPAVIAALKIASVTGRNSLLIIFRFRSNLYLLLWFGKQRLHQSISTQNHSLLQS